MMATLDRGHLGIIGDRFSDWSDADFADYLERVGGDYAESGNEATAEDYAEAARRIRGGGDGA
jgi:hypothetical protein